MVGTETEQTSVWTKIYNWPHWGTVLKGLGFVLAIGSGIQLLPQFAFVSPEKDTDPEQQFTILELVLTDGLL